MSKLKIGDKAPEFLLEISQDKKVSLGDLKEKYIVLYFYPKDDTPGCTLEAIDFNELLNEFNTLNTVVLGISRDDLKSHGKFKDKYNLKFNLGSDIDGQTCSKYSVWVEKSMYGKKYLGPLRAAYLFDGDGKLLAVIPKVEAAEHGSQVLAAIAALE